jgi:predicted nucleic acid-binding protein
MTDLPDTNVLVALHVRAHPFHRPGQVTDLHLLDLVAARGGRLVTFDAKIPAALKPVDRRHLVMLN